MIRDSIICKGTEKETLSLPVGRALFPSKTSIWALAVIVYHIAVVVSTPNFGHTSWEGFMVDRVAVYIDGFNLYYGMTGRGWRRYLWLDIYKFSMNILDKNQCLVKVRYFTSQVPYNPLDRYKVRRQQTYLKAIRELAGVCIHLGRYQQKKVMHHACGKRLKFPQEKMTDVNIATNLLCDAHDDLFDVAMIVSGDSDLVSAVDATCTRFDNKKAIVCFPPNRGSVRLKSVASGCKCLGREAFSKSQLPDPFIVPGKNPICRPQSWS